MIRNMVTGKLYIGQTTSTIAQRFVQHCSSAKRGSRSLLHRSIRKHGREAFQMFQVAWYNNAEDGHKAEKQWIRLLKTQSRGYNLSAGGEAPNSGGKHTEEWKKQHSEDMSGQNHPLWGKKHKPESIAKMRKSQQKNIRLGAKNHAYRDDIFVEDVWLMRKKKMTLQEIADHFKTHRHIIRNRLKEWVEKNPECAEEAKSLQLRGSKTGKKPL